ncbi:D-hexose-6-phosphate mutarotase [Acidicapsa ligni]|uniref:D-hexose-6-phosphate mutarotase n=1 Tax=Acidicapsa ligni TaxID=542300 RepID=UPI0021E03DDC|nr:D-hexose-6-phosphate mutarotase [Acidicapsa ligni]
MSDIANLNTHFSISGIASIVSGNNGLPKVQITTPAGSAEIYLHGAHVTSWKPADSSEVIFVSKETRWEDGKAIRGGVPICFPWFRAKSDNPKAPSHGVVRTKAWQLQSIIQGEDVVIVSLTTESDEETRKWWPHEFRLTHRVTVGKDLTLELITVNTGDTAFQIEEALHTYNRIGQIDTIRIAGLDGAIFLDNRDNNREKLQQGNIAFDMATDNAYFKTRHTVEIIDPTLKRRIRLEKQNSASTVVWNPWKEDAAKLADLGDDEWTQFACVEACNILDAAVTLAPNEEHIMTAAISVTN